jgi:hypothetical protein
MPAKSARKFGRPLFWSGIGLGFALAVAAVWAAFEAQSYFFSGATFEAYNGLRCPILMTRSEQGTITATFDNPADRESRPYYEVEISGRLARQFEDQLTVPAHESKTVQWTVSADDIDLDPFIFVRTEILPDGLHSTRQAICGILVLNVPGAGGGQVFFIMLIASLLAMTAGYGMWEKESDWKQANLQRAAQAAGIAVLLAMLTAFTGGWLAGIVFCVVALLLFLIILRFSLV